MPTNPIEFPAVVISNIASALKDGRPQDVLSCLGEFWRRGSTPELQTISDKLQEAVAAITVARQTIRGACVALKDGIDVTEEELDVLSKGLASGVQQALNHQIDLVISEVFSKSFLAE